MSNGLIYAIAFYATAAVAVASAFMVVWHRNPVISAVYLVLCFFAVAVDYVLLQAHFLAAIQVLVYAGAILVLFLMIVMLIHQDPRDLKKTRPTLSKALGSLAVFGSILMAVSLVVGFKAIHITDRAAPEELAAFLIDLGDHPGEHAVKVKLKPSGLSAEDRVLVARDVLKTINDPEVMSWVEMPEEFAEYPEHRLENIRNALLSQLATASDLSDLDVPHTELFGPDMKKRSRELAMSFIKAAARGRLRQLEEFGTTGAVGRYLFSKYLLPFEAASILLLAAIMGVLVLSRRLPGEEGR